MLFEKSALLARNDVAEATLALFHLVHFVFVLEDRRVVLELLYLRGPVDEYLFVEALEREVDRFIERALIELAC